MALSNTASVLKKAAARAALFNVDDKTAAMLRDCFKQFSVEVSMLKTADANRLQKEKVDACVVLLNDDAGPILEQARNSPSNRRVVVFGICDSVGEAVRFSKLGINVLLEKPIDRQAVLRAVRATHLLIINEFRRYVRIPIVAKLDGLAGMQHITGSTAEVSGGGMSIRFHGKLNLGDEVQLAFDLPGQPGIKVRGNVCWLRPTELTAGVRFETEQPGRDALKKWIDQYLEID
jgi:ActR/RegA family two-component response regulator